MASPGLQRPPAPGAGPAAGREFPCEQCGADLTFHIGAQSLKCPFCGHVKALVFEDGARVDENDLAAALGKQATRREGSGSPTPGDQEVACGGCGGITVFQGTLTSTLCAYCGAALQREGVHQATHRLPVDGLLTFQVERQAAERSLRAWVSSRWFAPGAFTSQGVNGKFEGVYMPYFTFDAMTSTNYRGQRGEHYEVTTGSGDNKRRERRTRWFSASGAFQRFFDDVLVPAVRSLPRKLLDSLEPWALDRLVPFSPQALAGKSAHTYEIPLEETFEEGKKRIEAELASDVRQRIGGDVQRIDEMQTAYAALKFKHLLLPVWMLAYRHAGKSYRVVVNATTGELTGERPWSAAKIALAVLFVAAVVGIIAALGNR